MGPGFVIITIVAIVCATTLIRKWLDKKNKNGIEEESFNRLARAFMQHKKEMSKRVQNLEEIIADKKEDEKKSYSEIEAPKNKERLTNDLKQKDRVRS